MSFFYLMLNIVNAIALTYIYNVIINPANNNFEFIFVNFIIVHYFIIICLISLIKSCITKYKHVY
jgi:hypothetical protein